MANLQFLAIFVIAIICANLATAQRGGGPFGGMGGGRGMGGPGRGMGGGRGGQRGMGGGSMFGRRPQRQDDDRCDENEMYRECRSSDSQVKQELTCEMAQKALEMRLDAQENDEEFKRPKPEMVDCEAGCRCKKFHVRMEDGSCAPVRECLGENSEEGRPEPWGNKLPQSRPRPFGGLGRPNREEADQCTGDNEMYYECYEDGRQVRQQPTCEMAQEHMQMRKDARENGEEFKRPEPVMVDCVAECKCRWDHVRNEDGVCIPMRECLDRGEEGSDEGEDRRRPGSNMRNRFRNMRNQLRNRLNNRNNQQI